MRSTSKLTTKEFEEIKIKAHPANDVEEALIKEHLGQVKIPNLTTEKESVFIKDLIKALDNEKQEGETRTVFEDRLKQDIDAVFKRLGVV